MVFIGKIFLLEQKYLKIPTFLGYNSHILRKVGKALKIKILAIGDVVGTPGLDCLRKHLPKLRRQHGIDFCVVNGENAAMVGMTAQQGETIFDAGADVITLGNHTWNQREITAYLDDNQRVLRPANFAPQLPGSGVVVCDTDFGRLAVVNLIGRCGLDFNADNPFTKMDGILKKLEGLPVLVDFHAEATSEKLAMGFFLDGKVSAVWGTHTHVPTADLRILPKGTGYLTDLGMTGPRDSALGVDPSQSIAMFRGELTSRFKPAPGPRWLCGAIFTLDLNTNRCIAVEQVQIVD